MIRRLAIVGLVAALAGCAATHPRRGRAAPPLPSLTSTVVAPSGTMASTGELPPKRYSAATIPGGVGCLLRLRKLGIPHVTLSPMRHVLTPVRVTGPIGMVHYRPTGRRPLVCDCRLVLALRRASGVFARLGVTHVWYSNTYRGRSRRAKRLSRHTLGLAIDVHRLTVSGQLHRVQDDFTIGCGDDPSCPLLNRVAEELRAAGVFDVVLTPDTDAAHFNHFHFAIRDHARRRFPRKRRRRPVITE